MMPVTPMVKHLIIINVIFYIGSNFLAKDISYDLFALYFPLTDNFYVWQILTHMFMHAEFNIMPAHIVFNMLGLYMFGSALEHFWGGKKFLFFYISCGIGAAMLHMGVQYFEIMQDVSNFGLNLSFEKLNSFAKLNEFSSSQLSTFLKQNNISNGVVSDDIFYHYQTIYYKMQGYAVGASGAIFGITVAYAFMFPNSEMMLFFFPFPIKAKYFVPALVGLDLFSGITGYSIFGGGGIAHFAHVGGALTGFIIMYMWRNKKFNFKRWN